MPEKPEKPTKTEKSEDNSADMEDRIVARLAEAFERGQPGQQVARVAPAFADRSEEDQRLVTALSGVHPSGRDVVIVFRDSVGTNLFFVEYSYAPATGASRAVFALVYDNGDRTHVFGGQ